MRCPETFVIADKIRELSADYEKASEYINSPQGREFIKRAYLMILGKSLRGSCVNCHMDAFIEVACFVRKPKFKEIMESSYQFKNSMVRELVIGDASITVTNHNITDEYAELMLIECPGLASNMNMPEDWVKRVAKRKESMTSAEASEEGTTEKKKKTKRNPAE